MKVVKVICALFIYGFVSVSHAGIFKLNVENGILMGADFVEVNDSFYNVRFLDGTCIDLFNGCDEASDFVFNTEQSAADATSALLAQVFVDGVKGMFDSEPDSTYGCDTIDVCVLYTVFQRGNAIRTYAAYNFGSASSFQDNAFQINFSAARDVTNGDKVWAVWIPAVEVSAPGTAMILLMGIAGLLVSQRRKQA